MNTPTFILLAGLALTGTAHAVDMYRWVDETGRIHYGDAVPEAYKRNSIQIKSTVAVLSSSQMQELDTPPAAAKAQSAGRKKPHAKHSANPGVTARE